MNCDIEIEASEIHGFYKEDLQDAPSFPEVWTDFDNLIRNASKSRPNGPLPLIAYNSPFDMRFLKQTASSNDMGLDLTGTVERCAMRSVSKALKAPDHRHEFKWFKCATAHHLLVSAPFYQPLWSADKFHDAAADTLATSEIICGAVFIDLHSPAWDDCNFAYAAYAGGLGEWTGADWTSKLLLSVSEAEGLDDYVTVIDRLDCDIPVRSLSLRELSTLVKNRRLNLSGLFWQAWRQNSELMKALGFRATKNDNGEWVLVLLLHPEEIEPLTPSEQVELLEIYYHD